MNLKHRTSFYNTIFVLMKIRKHFISRGKGKQFIFLLPPFMLLCNYDMSLISDEAIIIHNLSCHLLFVGVFDGLCKCIIRKMIYSNFTCSKYKSFFLTNLCYTNFTYIMKYKINTYFKSDEWLQDYSCRY